MGDVTERQRVGGESEKGCCGETFIGVRMGEVILAFDVYESM